MSPASVVAASKCHGNKWCKTSTRRCIKTTPRHLYWTSVANWPSEIIILVYCHRSRRLHASRFKPLGRLVSPACRLFLCLPDRENAKKKKKNHLRAKHSLCINVWVCERCSVALLWCELHVGGQTHMQLPSLQVCIPPTTGHKVTLCFYGCSPWCSAEAPEMTKSLSRCLWPKASLSGTWRSCSLMWTPNWNRSPASFQGLIPPLQAYRSSGSAVSRLLSDCLSVLLIFSGRNC